MHSCANRFSVTQCHASLPLGAGAPLTRRQTHGALHIRGVTVIALRTTPWRLGLARTAARFVRTNQARSTRHAPKAGQFHAELPFRHLTWRTTNANHSVTRCDGIAGEALAAVRIRRAGARHTPVLQHKLTAQTDERSVAVLIPFAVSLEGEQTARLVRREHGDEPAGLPVRDGLIQSAHQQPVRGPHQWHWEQNTQHDGEQCTPLHFRAFLVMGLLRRRGQ